MGKITAAITGIQGYVPEHVLSNEDLSKIVDTNDEWITSRTGSKHRDHALSIGVNKYLGKPYQEEILLESIAELLEVQTA